MMAYDGAHYERILLTMLAQRLIADGTDPAGAYNGLSLVHSSLSRAGKPLGVQVLEALSEQRIHFGVFEGADGVYIPTGGTIDSVGEGADSLIYFAVPTIFDGNRLNQDPEQSSFAYATLMHVCSSIALSANSPERLRYPDESSFMHQDEVGRLILLTAFPDISET